MKPRDELAGQNHEAREREARRAALLDEREKCERAGQTGRVELIDAELERLDALPKISVVAIDREQAEIEAGLEREAHVAALIRERDTYERRGLPDRVELVNAELRRLGSAQSS